MSPTTQDLKFIDIKFSNGIIKDIILESSFKEFFIEFSRTKSDRFVSLPSSNLRILCKRLSLNGFNLLVHIGEHFEDLILDLRSYSDTFCPFSIHENTNNLSNYLMNHIEKADDSVYTKINESLNKMYKCFQVINSNLANPQNTQEVQPVQESQQPTKPVTESTIQVVKPAISPKEFYSKEFTVKHLEYHIPNEFRKLVKKYGVLGNTNNILRAIDLKSKICFVMMRKTKTKSILRLNKKYDNKLTLKIGTGDYLVTNLSDRFEWREPHTEENIQHIKDAFLELNNWYKEKKELFEKEKIEKKELKKKEKIAKELKKKETETKLIEALEKGEFKALE